MSSTPKKSVIPALRATYARTGQSKKNDEWGMRPMQRRAYLQRGEQYLLIKSPPASGKSRALMFIALDKVHHQGLKQALVIVPERSIGASFHDEPLKEFGFWADWHVRPCWNLCDATGVDESKVGAVERFLGSDDAFLICTHATFRFAFEALGAEAFDGRLLAVDEFHHVSANPDNVLGAQIAELIARDKTHIVAMTGSYFRGDTEAVLHPVDEAKFATVTYTYYEQLNGYDHLKQLDIGYYFYSGAYIDEIIKVLEPDQKTIVHIPSVNSRESTKDKLKEVEEICDALGQWEGTDPETGFLLIRTPGGRVLRVADLVDDEPNKRQKVVNALGDPSKKHVRDHVDMIIALGMAKEGFDWIWCEYALTVGYRASLTEVVQIIGRTTRDAPGKERARFINLIAEPDASEETVTEAVNDTLKAIAASLLMEQVLAPRFDFRAKRAGDGPTEGLDYGPDGYQDDENACNVGVNPETGQIEIEIKGLKEPKSPEAQRICREDLTEVISSFVQDKEVVERGVFDLDLMPQELTQIKMAKVIKAKFPELDEDDQEAVRQHAVAAMALTQQAKRVLMDEMGDEAAFEAHIDQIDHLENARSDSGASADASGRADDKIRLNTAFVDGVRRYVLDVRQLDMDLIDSVNPFSHAYSVLSKAMNETNLKRIEAAITAKKLKIPMDEAKDLAGRAVQFKRERGRLPSATSADPWEQRLAAGAAAFMRYRKDGLYEQG